MTAMPSSASAVDELVDLGDRADIDAARRLVEDDQLRLLHQRLGDDHLLLVAAGKLDDARVAVDGLDARAPRSIAWRWPASRSC